MGGATGQNLVLDNTITTTGDAPVFFDLEGTAVISAAGDITTIGAGGDGAVTIDAVGGITTAGDVTTDDDNINFITATVLSGDVVFSTGDASTGSIVFGSTLDSDAVAARDLTATSGRVTSLRCLLVTPTSWMW